MASLLSLLLLLLLLLLFPLDIGCTLHGNVLLASSNNSTGFYEAGKAHFSPQENSSFWVSPDGNFTFGFKELANDKHLLSIWLSADAEITAALWWPANASNVTIGAVLDFTSQGNLQLSDANGFVVWGTARDSSVRFAELKNTGNLVLLDENGTIQWQSFADLRDTLLLPQNGVNSTDYKALVINKTRLLQSRVVGSYVAGRFHLETDYFLNVYLHALDQRLNVDFIYKKTSMNVSGKFQIGPPGRTFHGNELKPNNLRYLYLNHDGDLRVYSWNSSTNSWDHIWDMERDKCKLGSPCGAYGICSHKTSGKIHCSCPTSSYHFLDAEDHSQGCVSSFNFSAICASGGNTNASMAVLEHSDYQTYNELNNVVHAVADIDECKTLCLNNCTCVAASHTNYDNVCILMTGFLMNGHITDDYTLLIKIKVSASSSDQVTKREAIGTGVASAVVMVVMVSGGAWLLKRRWHQRWGGQHDVKMHSDTGPMKFAYQQLVKATNNFAEVLGEGGFGNVYKGWVMQEKMGTGFEPVAVAVKVLKRRILEEEGAYGKRMKEEAEKQFRAEVATLGKIHHINLVNLLGYCTGERAGEKRVLVYECVEMGSLDKYLSKVHIGEKPLSWPIRYSIALGIARGIAYLHHECNPCILHCDIKPQNVLLDHNFTAKVADFGLARPLQQKSHLTVSGVRGTRGYMAPEWLTSDKVTPKVDVYSFGMVLLQLAWGFQDREDDEISLVDWAFCFIEECAAALQPNNGDTFHSNHGNQRQTAGDQDEQRSIMVGNHSGSEQEEKLKLLKIGLWCVQYLPALRPSMARIVQLIEGSSPEYVDKPPYPTPQMPITVSLLSSDGEQISSSPTVSLLSLNGEQISRSPNAYSGSIISGRITR